MAKRTPKTGGVMTESQMVAALLKHFPRNEYAFLQQVRNATGYSSRVTRTADAIALSLWPSRGLGMHGFEFKRYRGDWKREKENPAKAEEIARFCDFWWLVVTDARIIDVSEVPDTWGLKAPNEDGTALVTLKTAVRMEPEPWTKGFIAAVLRNASDTMLPVSAVAAQVEQARQDGFNKGKGESPDGEAERELKDLRELKQRVEEFERASGLQIRQPWNKPREVGDAVSIVLNSLRSHARIVQAVAQQAKYFGAALETQTHNLKLQVKAEQERLQEHAEQLAALMPALGVDGPAQTELTV